MDEKDFVELLKRACEAEKEGRLDEAVSAYVALARGGWDRFELLDPFERLFQIHLHRREIDAAWCAASVLEDSERLEGTALEFYEDYVPRRLRARRGRLDAEAWKLLRDPDENTAVTAMLDAVAVAAKLSPPDDPRIDPAVLAWAADALGARDGAVALVDPPLDAHASLEEVGGGYLLRERLFFAGREATAFVAPSYALAGWHWRQLDAVRGAFERRDLTDWQSSIQRTRHRAGLLVCGEPAVARALLRMEGATDKDLADLAAFIVSPEHHRLRALLGVAVGMGADVDPAPAPDPAPALAPAPAPAPAPVPGSGVVEFGSADRRARSMVEMRFAVSIRGCTRCGAPPPQLELFGAQDRWALCGTCGYCREKLVFRFWTSGDPTKAEQPQRALGGGPSQILGRSELGAELERVKGLLSAEPEKLVPPERALHDEALGRAMTCVLELLKLAPDDAALAAERDRLVALGQPRALSFAPAVAHARPLDAILRTLFDAAGPPPTVGALEQAVGVELAELHIAACEEGRLTLGFSPARPLQKMVIRWVVRGPVTTLAALRARPLTSGWFLDLTVGRAAIDAALRERFGAPRALPRRHDYRTPHGVFLFSWPEEGDGGFLGFALPGQ